MVHGTIVSVVDGLSNNHFTVLFSGDKTLVTS